MPCDYCEDNLCRYGDCQNLRKTDLPKGRVCSGCGNACLNIRLYNKDCLGRKDGVSERQYARLELDRKFEARQK